MKPDSGATTDPEGVLAVIDALLAADPNLSSADLAARLSAEPGLAVHPRSIERALARRKKGAR